MSKVLLAYYSRSGYTATIARQLADASGWDVERIEDQRPRTGGLGFVRSLLDAVSGRRPPIRSASKDPANYALVVLGSPVWMGRLAAPMRTYLAAQRERFPQLAWFCTYGGKGADVAARQVAVLSGRPLAATLAITDADVDQARYWDRLGDFQKRVAELVTA